MKKADKKEKPKMDKKNEMSKAMPKMATSMPKDKMGMKEKMGMKKR